MDRLKEIGSSAREKAGLAPKKSYHNYSDSRISTAKTHPDTLSKIKGLVPDRVTGIVSRGRSGSNSSQDSAPSSYRSHTVVDPASFGPPPKHRAAYGDEVASASIAGGAPPPYDSPPGAPLQRRATIEAPESRRAPPPPPRIPSRRGTESYPASREVTDEDVASRGGLSTGAVGALGRLGKSGIHIPGFGTSKETAPPPPPTSSRPKIGSTASRWRTNSDAAPTGTTLEEKKAAVKTIDQLYKDPTKVSFKDAKAATGTARNFQQRHGGQVAEGARLANKYGLIGNEMTREPTQQSDIRTPPSPQSPQHVKYEPPPPPRRSVPSTPTAPYVPPLPPQRSTPTSPTQYHSPSSPQRSLPPPLPARKPPPPLPPKRKPPPPLPPTIGSRPQPPPVPISSRPPPIPQTSRPSPSSVSSPTSFSGCSLRNSGYPPHLIPELPVDLDLCLHTEWFTTNPLRLPPSIQNNPDKSLRYSASWTRAASGRTNHTLILAVLWTLNLSSTKIKLTWDASAPAETATAQQRHFPPPQPLTAAELEQLVPKGREIVAWCEERHGTRVGDGECWTLAHQATTATSGIMESQRTSHGACIFSHHVPGQAEEAGVDIRAGDIMQFWKAEWTFEGGGWKKAGDPDHTAVVVGATRDSNGSWVCQVLEQNVGNAKHVQHGEYVIGTNSGMHDGAARVFRPVWEGMVNIDTEWN